MRAIESRPFLLSLLSGVLMGSAFHTAYFWWAGAVGLSLFILGLRDIRSRKQAFWYGWFGGTVKTLIAASWVWSVFPLDWMGDFSPVSQAFGIAWMWVTGSVGVGASIGIFAWVIQPYLSHTYRYWIIPSMYVIAELIGSLFFSIIQYGPGGTVNVHTSFGYLGYTLGEHGVLGILARGAGVYGLSFVVALVALSLAILIDRYRWGVEDTKKIARYASIIVIICVTYFLPSPFVADKVGIRVATVNTHFENRFDMTALERADRVRLIIDAFEAALLSESDIILFPETSYSLSVFGTSENVFSYIESKTENDVLVIDSDKLPNIADGTSEVRAVMYDTKTREVHSAYKKFLVPSGEFVPYQLSFMMSLFGFRETSDMLGEALEFVPGEDTAHTSSRIPAVLFCSESVSPVRSFSIAKHASLPLIVHPISHAWLNNPDMFWYQLDLMLRTQARFARLPIVQAANMAESLGYDAFGNSITGETIFETASTSVVVYDV